jgi:hypothetical protein
VIQAEHARQYHEEYSVLTKPHRVVGLVDASTVLAPATPPIYDAMVRLLRSLAPEAEPLPDAAGVLTQIDNWCAGRVTPQGEPAWQDSVGDVWHILSDGWLRRHIRWLPDSMSNVASWFGPLTPVRIVPDPTRAEVTP